MPTGKWLGPRVLNPFPGASAATDSSHRELSSAPLCPLGVLRSVTLAYLRIPQAPHLLSQLGDGWVPGCLQDAGVKRLRGQVSAIGGGGGTQLGCGCRAAGGPQVTCQGKED